MDKTNIDNFAEDCKARMERYMNNFQYGNYDFERWDTIRVAEVIVDMTGINGTECQEMAIVFMAKFINWYKTRHDDYYKCDSFGQLMYSTNCLASIYDIANDNRDQISVNDALILFHSKIQADIIRRDNLKRDAELIEVTSFDIFDMHMTMITI